MAKAKSKQPNAIADAVLAPMKAENEVLGRKAAELSALLDQFKLIETPAQYEEACRIRGEAVAFVAAAVRRFSGTDEAPGPKKLLYAAYKSLGDLEGEIVAPAQSLVDGLKRPILDFEDRQERLRLDSEEAARTAAGAIAADDAEITAAIAAEDAGVEIAPAVIESAKAVAAATAGAAITLPRSTFIPAIAGQSRSENWIGEITDVEALLRQLLDPARQSLDPEPPTTVKLWRARVIEALGPLVNLKARDLKASGAGRFDGVRFYDDPKLTQRGARG